MPFVVFHHWTDIYIYCIVYVMCELNLGLVSQYSMSSVVVYCCVTKYSRLYKHILYIKFWFLCVSTVSVVCIFTCSISIRICLFLHAVALNMSKENTPTCEWILVDFYEM